jgi:hypothetical protein
MMMWGCWRGVGVVVVQRRPLLPLLLHEGGEVPLSQQLLTAICSGLGCQAQLLGALVVQQH